MEVTVLQRINQIIEDSDKTKNLVANEIGMSSTTVWRQLKGEQALSSRLIEGVLAAFPNVSAEWLLRGKGEMYLGGFAKTQNDKAVEAMSTPIRVAEDSMWKTKYETIKECYDSLLASLGGIMGKRNVG